MKHSGREWHANELQHCTAIETETGSRVCTLWKHYDFEGKPCGSIESQDKTPEEIEANIRLITKAPALLKSCKDLLNIVMQNREQGLNQGSEYVSIVRGAQAAVDMGVKA